MANIKVNISTNTGERTVLEIKQGISIADLLRMISEWNGVAVENQSVSFSGLRLKTELNGKPRCISDYNIENNSNLIVTVERKEIDEGVELTDLPDMITWDDDPNNKRAKMPCGHAIGPESLTAYCRSLLSAGKYQFRCPYVDYEKSEYCGKVWEYYIVRRLAVLTESERSEFETKLSQNYMRKASGIQECPQCTSYCNRQNKKDRRVVCLVCSKDGDRYEFCWNCLGKWKTIGTEKCGNETCSGEDHRLKILRDSSKKEIVGLANCPSVRACPKCGILISHERDCKHMVCMCGQKFCFICLKKAVEGRYQCGTYKSHCTIAAVQTTMPEESTEDEVVPHQNNTTGSSCMIM